MQNIFSRSESGEEVVANTGTGMASSSTRVKTSASTDGNSSLDMVAYLSISIVASFIAIAGVLALFKPIRVYSEASEATDLDKKGAEQTNSNSLWIQVPGDGLPSKTGNYPVPPSPTVPGIHPGRRIANYVADKLAMLVHLFALNSDNRAKEGWELVPLSWAQRKSVEKEEEREAESMEGGGARSVILLPAIPSRVSTPRPSTPKPRAERRTSGSPWPSSRARSACVPREVEVSLIDLAVYCDEFSPSNPGLDEKPKPRMEMEIARETCILGDISKVEPEETCSTGLLPPISTLSASSWLSQTSSLPSATEKDVVEAAMNAQTLTPEFSAMIGAPIRANDQATPFQGFENNLWVDSRSTAFDTQFIRHNSGDYTVYNGLSAVVKSYSLDSTGSGHYDGYAYYEDDPFSDKQAAQNSGQEMDLEKDLEMGVESLKEPQENDAANLDLEAVEEGLAQSMPYQTHALFPIFSLPSFSAPFIADSRVPFVNNTEADDVKFLDRSTMLRKRLEPARLEPVLLDSLVTEKKLDGSEVRIEAGAGPSPLLVLPPTPSRNRVYDDDEDDEAELGSIVEIEISPIDTEFERISMPATPTSPSWVDGSSPVMVQAPSIFRPPPVPSSPRQRFPILTLSISGSPSQQTTLVPDALASPTDSLLIPAYMRNELPEPLQTLSPLPTPPASPPKRSARTPLEHVSPLFSSSELTRIPSESSIARRFLSGKIAERVVPSTFSTDEGYSVTSPAVKLESELEDEVGEELSSDAAFAFTAQSPPPVHVSIRTPSPSVSNLPSLVRRDSGNTIFPSSPSSLQTIPGESPVTPHSIMTIPEESPLTPTQLSAGGGPGWSASVVTGSSLGSPCSVRLTGSPTRDEGETREETDLQLSSLSLDHEPMSQEQVDDPPLHDIPHTMIQLRCRRDVFQVSPTAEVKVDDPPLASINELPVPSTLLTLPNQPPRSIDFILAMQLRPNFGLGADAAWALKFLMAMFGWFTVLISRRVEDSNQGTEGREIGNSEATRGDNETTAAEEDLSGDSRTE